MGSDPFQRGGWDPPLWGSERGLRPGEAYVCPGRRPLAPPRVGWSGNLLGLSLAGEVQFELRPQVGPLSLRGGGQLSKLRERKRFQVSMIQWVW